MFAFEPVESKTVKVQIEVQGKDPERFTKVLEMAVLPCAGDMVDVPELGSLKVVSVVHTPFKTGYSAVLTLKTGRDG